VPLFSGAAATASFIVVRIVQVKEIILIQIFGNRKKTFYNYSLKQKTLILLASGGQMQDFQLYLNQDTIFVTCQLVKHQELVKHQAQAP